MGDTKQTSDDATEPAVEPEPKPKLAPEPEPGSEPEPEREPDPDAETDKDPETDADPDTQAKEPSARVAAPTLDDDPGLPYPTRLGWVVAAFLLFWPLAVPALVLSLRTAEANGTSNARRAKKSSVHALDFALGAVALGVVGIVALVVGVAAAPAYAASLPAGLVATVSSFVPPVLAGPLGITADDDPAAAAPTPTTEPTDGPYLGAEPYPDGSAGQSDPSSTSDTDDRTDPSDDDTTTPDTSDSDGSTSDSTATAGAQIPDLEVGDCIDTAATSGQTTLYRIPVVSCTTSHGGEIYAETTASDDLATNGAAPTQQELWDAADAYCYPRFAKFVGMQWARSELLYWPIAPSKESWAEGDRRVLCVVESDDPVQGSLKGTAR